MYLQTISNVMLKASKADALADHIVVLYRGNLVCQGSSTALKAKHGDGYHVVPIGSLREDNTFSWKFSTSADATRKVLELENAGTLCDVKYPTLEQVFLEMTSDSNSTRLIGGDGLIGDEEAQTTSNDNLDFLTEEESNTTELHLEVAKPIGMAMQVWVLFRKRLLLLRSTWFTYLVNLAIPIVVAAILFKYIQQWTTLTTCDTQRDALFSGPPLDDIPGYPGVAGNKIAALCPRSSFTGIIQDELLVDSAYVVLFRPQSPLKLLIIT